jgi:NADH pyrophosphatase NudC (nudix superfamily)
MLKLKFCPQCGKPNLEWQQEKKWYCKACNFTLYHNVASAVAVVIQCGNEILFTKRNQEPQKGKLDLVGGFSDAKESAEKTCQREIWEELHWKIEVEKLQYITSLPNTYRYREVMYQTLDLFYLYKIDEKPAFIVEKSEISSVEWRSLESLHLEDLAFESQKIFFKTFRLN